MTTAQNPVIILVRPQLGENIGKAARAMLNFGLTEMRLVAPRDGWPNPDAGPSASGADQILEEAVVYDSLAEAAHDRTHLYATTVRKRGVTKQVLTPTEAAQEIHGLKTTMPDARPAFVFGPERSGLDSADVTLCRSIITVPVNPEFGSLNLAQAVILLSYQWAMLAGQDGVDAGAVDMPPPAPQDELEGLINALNDALAKRGYFFPPERTEATQRTLRNILTRPAWSSQEIRTLRGVVTNLDKK